MMVGEWSDVEARAAELVDLLGSPDAEIRLDAVWRGGDAVRRWRGPYGNLIATLGERLRDSDPEVRSAAARVCERLYSTAQPAADHLAGRVAADVDLWNLAEPVHGGVELRRIAASLARLGDPRAIPSLAANVDRHPRLAVTVVLSLSHFRDHAEDFVPGLRQRLARGARALPAEHGEALLAVTGLRCVAGVEGTPEVLQLLRAAATSETWPLAREALRTLATFGPVAADAEIRPYLTSPQPRIAVAAAHVLSAWPANADSVLPVLLPRLESDSPAERDTAFAALRRLGPAAWEVAGRVRELHDALRELVDDGANDGRAVATWGHIIDCAIALWHLSGDGDAVLPTLIDAWPSNPHRRADIVDCLAQLGPAAAPALPLLRAEVATPERYWTDGGPTDLIKRDEALLAKCRDVLSAAGPG